MEERLLDKIAEPFNLKLPEYETLEGMLDGILPAVAPYSYPTLTDEDAPFRTISWARLTDRAGDNRIVLYHFMDDRGEVRVVVDGLVSALTYELEDDGRRIILGRSGPLDSEYILYNLAFMDEDFLILSRHGNPANLEHRYLLLVRESLGVRLTWNEALERLVDRYRNNRFPWVAVGLVGIGVVGVVWWFF